jgi:prepilin-type N-terminal cleavage/methylation domain-containing protein
MNRLRKDQRGLTLIELVIFVAIIGIIAAAVIPLCTNEKTQKQARADVEKLASAVLAYGLHTGKLPAELTDLTRPVSAHGKTADPFINSIPTPPQNWKPYTYTPDGPFKFTISTSIGRTSVTITRP